jgi:hypothetical protein
MQPCLCPPQAEPQLLNPPAAGGRPGRGVSQIDGEAPHRVRLTLHRGKPVESLCPFKFAGLCSSDLAKCRHSEPAVQVSKKEG